MPTFSPELETTIRRASALAFEGQRHYTTLEHLLLALTFDPDAVQLLVACRCDVARLQSDLEFRIDNDLELRRASVNPAAFEPPAPTAAHQRVIQRAIIHVQSSGHQSVTGANVVVAIFAERHSHAALLLQDQHITRYDAVNFLAHGLRKGSR